MLTRSFKGYMTQCEKGFNSVKYNKILWNINQVI